MIESLSKLTMSQYIDLVCGDTSVLLTRHEFPNKDKLAKARVRIMYEFAELSNESGAKTFVRGREREQRAYAELLLFQVCNNLLALNAVEEVRQILIQYGIRAQEYDVTRIAKEVDRLMKRAETGKKRNRNEEEETEEPSEDEIRRNFDKQTASLMTYFKFQIDLNTIPASQYACMIDQANKEIKAKLQAMSKK